MAFRRMRLSREGEGGESLLESNSRSNLRSTFHKAFHSQIVVPPRYELQFLALFRKDISEEVICKICVKICICVTHKTNPKFLMFV